MGIPAVAQMSCYDKESKNRYLAEAVKQFLQFAADTARELGSDALVYDPVRPQMERLKGMERGQLLFQAATRSALQRILRQLTSKLRKHSLGSRIRWAVDVDPQEF